MSTPEATPEGALIKTTIQRSGRSQRSVAEDVGISETRLRQIMNGWASAGQGQRVAVSAPAETLARIAMELDLPADAFAEIRPDVAEVLQHWLTQLQETRPLKMSTPEQSRHHEMLLRKELAAWLHDPGDGYPPDATIRLYSQRQLLQGLADEFYTLERLVAGGQLAAAYDYRIRVEEIPTSRQKRWLETPEGRAWQDGNRVAREWARENMPEYLDDEGDETDADSAEAQEKMPELEQLQRENAQLRGLLESLTSTTGSSAGYQLALHDGTSIPIRTRSEATDLLAARRGRNPGQAMRDQLDAQAEAPDPTPDED